MKKKKYYEVSFDDSDGGVAFVPDEYLYEYYDKVREIDSLPFEIILEDGSFKDFLPNNLGYPLMSDELKALLDTYKGTAPAYKWTKVVVNAGPDGQRKYYFYIPLEKPTVLDMNRTRFTNGSDYIYAIFLYSLISSYSFFPQQAHNKNNIVVSETIKDAIKRSKFNGMEFEKADITFD